MATINGTTLTREEVRALIGHERQIASVEHAFLADGNAAGCETLDFRTGSGLSFQVLPSRGMDIGRAEFRGRPLGWLSRTGPVEPSHLGGSGFEPRRGSLGGLVSTCGYAQVGAPCAEDGTEYCLHGRAQLCPAENVSWDAEWEDGEYRLSCRGKVREMDKFQEYFENTRTIVTSMGAKGFRMEDRVRNLSFSPQPHMILYHINLGWPLLSGHSRVYAPSETRRRRGGKDIDFDWTRYPDKPEKKPEEVLYHIMRPGRDGMVRAALVNETPGEARWGLEIAYSHATLPRFVQWIQPSPGAYVLGLEPSNCWTEGRAKHRQDGDLVILQPDEERRYLLEFRVLDGEAEVARSVERINEEK